MPILPFSFNTYEHGVQLCKCKCVLKINLHCIRAAWHCLQNVGGVQIAILENLRTGKLGVWDGIYLHIFFLYQNFVGDL